jgi:hypothetical protein
VNLVDQSQIDHLGGNVLGLGLVAEGSGFAFGSWALTAPPAAP